MLTLYISHTIRSSKQNKCRPRILATISTCGTRMCILRIVTDTHWAIARIVCVLRLVSKADSRKQDWEAERMLTTAHFLRPSCIIHMYHIQPLLLSTSFQTNYSQWLRHAPILILAQILLYSSYLNWRLVSLPKLISDSNNGLCPSVQYISRTTHSQSFSHKSSPLIFQSITKDDGLSLLK